MAVISLPLAIRVRGLLSSGRVALPLAVRVVGGVMPTTKLSLPVEVCVVPASWQSGIGSPCLSTDTAAAWTIVVTVDNVDVSSMLIGAVRIDAEEGAARVADLSLKLPAGAVVSPSTWTGRPVTIDVADFSGGAAGWRARRFTGVVDTPSLSLADGTLALRCTDDLQGRVDGMTNAQLLALIGGYESSAVFDAAAIGWNYAQDRLSTVAASLDISPSGEMRVMPWAPKASPDISLDADLVGDGSLSVTVANRSSLLNQVNVEFDYRIPRVKCECYSVSYSYVSMLNFAQFILDGGWFLQRDAVVSALESSGGKVESITYEPLPTWNVAVGAGYWTPGQYDDTLCMGFSATVSFAYSQTVEEQHRITVANALSIASVGVRRETMTGALEGEYPDTTAVETGIVLYKAAMSSIPPLDLPGATVGQTTAVDTTLSDETNRDAANAAMEALIAVAKVKIYASHRANRVSATVPFMPAIDIDKTVEINAAGVHAIGKCVGVVDSFDADTGSAITEVTLALCSVAGVGIVHDEDETAASEGTTATSTSLGGLVEVVYNSGAAEDHKITVTFPAVDETERANATTKIDKAIAAAVVEDVFSITVQG